MSPLAYDIVGDVHGCADELRDLLGVLGYRLRKSDLTPPAGRQLIFVGDLVNRGPDTAGVLELVMRAADAGHARAVMGNHDRKLLRALGGQRVNASGPLAPSLQQLARRSRSFTAQVEDFLAELPPRLVLDGGRLLVVHAGDLPYAPDAERREYNVTGRKTGRRDALGLEERHDWVTPYRERALVVYGHTPVLEPQQRGRTLNLDTGCVYGGQLSALRYPELELLSVAARRAYATGKRWRVLSASRQAKGAESEE